MKKIITLLTLALIATQALAQHDEQVTVEGKYRPKVNKVNKLVLKPETPQPTYDLPDTDVQPVETKQKFSLDLEKISPTAFSPKKDQLVTPTKNFLLAGLGTRISPVFMYKHNSMLTKSLALGVGVSHNSSWLNIKDYAPSSYMNNGFDVYVTNNDFGNYMLRGGISYDNDMYHYYGVNLTENELTEEQIETYCPRQTYNTVGAELSLASTSTKYGMLNHFADMNYHYTFDRFGCSDHLLGMTYGFDYPVSWWGKKAYPQVIKLNAAFDYDSYSVYDSTDHTMRMELNPAFEMSDEFYSLHLGFVVDGGNLNPAKNGLKWSIRPDLKGSLYVLDRKLEFYAGLNGGMKMFDYRAIIEENPFVYHLQPMRMQNVKLGFDGGVRTNIVDIVDLHLGVRYRHTDDDPFFVMEPELVGNEIIYNKFDIFYDETRSVSVLADARVKMRIGLTADLSFAYNKCTPTVLDKPLYRPTTEGKLKLTYDFNEQLAFNASFLYQGGRWARLDPVLATTPSFKLKDVFDFGLGADYKLSEQITAFALLDNLACQKYQLYYNYPVTGIQLYAGVKLRF